MPYSGLSEPIARSKLAQESLIRYQLSLAVDCRTINGEVLGSGGANKFSISAGGWDSGTLILQGVLVEALQTKNTYLSFEFVLPPEYIAGSAVKLNIHARCYESGAVSATTRTIDIQVYELGDDGTVGGDLCSTGIQDLPLAWADTPVDGWDITSGGLVAGDRLRVLLKTIIVADDGGPGDVSCQIGSIEMQLNIKG